MAVERSGPRILVTGGAGYIGSHTCKALAQSGFLPVTLDNLVYGHRRAVKWGPLIVGDLADRSLVERVIAEHQVRAVVHFAAYAYVGESMSAPGKYFQNNVSNTLKLLEAMHAQGVDSIVFSSTCATYGLPERIPIDESQAQRPVNPYGESKLFIERALYWYGQAHGLRSAALRYFNAAGADPDNEIGEDHDPETHLIPLVIETALGRRPHIEVFGTDYDTPDGTAIRDYIHVSDLAEAHVLALRHLLDGGADLRLNLGMGQGHSVREVISAVEKHSRHEVAWRDSPRRPGDPAALVADARKARQVLGWTPHLSSLDQIVATAWNWHARHAHAASPTATAVDLDRLVAAARSVG
jgi:UDP-glucose-4-epimerase GalE